MSRPIDLKKIDDFMDYEADMPKPIEGENEAMIKISKLVESAASMQKLAEQKTKATEHYFNTLKERLKNSTAFLSNIKNDIENIKFNFHRNQLREMNTATYVEYNDKTDEELDIEMDRIKDRLKELQERVHTVQNHIKDNDTFEETMSKTVKMLENASKGKYDDGDKKE